MNRVVMLLFPQACRTDARYTFAALCLASLAPTRALICHYESQLAGNSPPAFDDECCATSLPSIDLSEERNMTTSVFLCFFVILLMQLLRDGM